MKARRAKTWHSQGLVYASRPRRASPPELQDKKVTEGLEKQSLHRQRQGFE